jgi:mycothiol synthase
LAEFLVRPLEPADIDSAYELLAGWQAQVFGESEISHGMFSNFQQIVDHAFVAESAEGIIGHADMRAGDMNVLVRDSERRHGVGSALLRACEAKAKDERLGLIGVKSEPAAAPFAAANGYRKIWEVWLMGIDLPDSPASAEWPDGISVRTFRPEDAGPLKALLDLAYREEPNHTPLPLEDWKTFMLGDPSFDPEAWFLALDGEQIVGAALNWKEGYVKDLVVHPDWRGRGLGRSLMLQTFAEFARRGAERVTLKTDSINPTGAWRLYERVGMKTERTYEVFEKRL